MNFSRISVITVIILTVIFSWCNRDKDNNPVEDLNTFLYTQAHIDSMTQVFNQRLHKVTDSLQHQLDVLEVKANIPAETITKIVTKYKVEYVDTTSTNLTKQLDSLQNIHNKTVEELQANNEMNKRRYQELLRTTMEASNNLPDTVRLHNDFFQLEVTLPEKLVSLSVHDTLYITHTSSRKWFLGKKHHKVVVTNANPHVELSGTTYLIK